MVVVGERITDAERAWLPAVEALLKDIGEKPGDLTMVLRRFVLDEVNAGELKPLPAPRYLHLMDLDGPNKGERINAGAPGDADL